MTTRVTRLSGSGLTRAMPVIGLQIENLTLRDVLTALCLKTEAHFVIKDGAVCLFSGKTLAEGRRP